MLIIPAIDIKDGRCVRLYQGDMDQETVYYQEPLDAARHLVEEGARMIHVVDLNGAVEGRPVHLSELAGICAESGVAVEVGGGLRTLEAVEQAMAAGVARVVIGTKAYEDPEFLRGACERFPGQVVVGIDARAGKVAVRGWRDDTAMDALELARRCEQDGAARIIYTDISRDGTGAGVNAEQTAQVARAVGIPVIASGGVGSLDDIRALAGFAGDGIEGVIVGRALYNGAFTIAEAMAAAGGGDAD
ncbi:MAG: 1-(5-phosphoribosyl)-5-[(5-phosphoribosylamino)methylideneamino]imidazole-4-carboxamide isomerase [Deltaproteobacteria bacterium]|nr:1-(5-phosphoribosyl)-5-[(5-phosphoribosylamino)methylideneamino]imidazole-4-carboxamide isomerase [Deltaproteobacteria bacterium]